MTAVDSLFKTETYSILNAPAYPMAEASRLVGISEGRITRWLKGYSYQYTLGDGKRVDRKKDSVVQRTRPKDSTQVSFLELVDLLFVSRFLNKGFSLQKIRLILDDAYKYLETPHFASAQFITLGRQVFLGKRSLDPKAKDLMALLTGGQWAFPDLVEPIGEKIDFEEVTGFELATRWYPQGRSGDIVIDPQISFGQPTVIGYRVTTANLYDFYVGENKNTERLATLFNVPREKIKSAIQFEHSIHS